MRAEDSLFVVVWFLFLVLWASVYSRVARRAPRAIAPRMAEEEGYDV